MINVTVCHTISSDQLWQSNTGTSVMVQLTTTFACLFHDGYIRKYQLTLHFLANIFNYLSALIELIDVTIGKKIVEYRHQIILTKKAPKVLKFLKLIF